MYLWQSLLVCFGSLSLHEYKSLTHQPLSRRDQVMLQYAVIAGQFIQFNLPFIWCKSPTLQLAKASHTIIESPPCRGDCNSFTNSLTHIDLHIWPKRFKLWFISPKDFIPLLYYPVFLHHGPQEPFDIVLLPQQWFLDCNQFFKRSLAILRWKLLRKTCI